MAGEPLANILVVDDTEAICKALRDVLTLAGYAVRTAPSGERALQILETAQMDLVITDLKMSGISGIQLLKKIKDKSPNTPVIILTGYGDTDSAIEAMRAGVADYLKKPFAVNEVLQVVTREVSKSKLTPVAVMMEASSVGAAEAVAQQLPRKIAFSAKDTTRIDAVLSSLRAQTTAESVLLIEDTGHLVSSKGMLSNADLPTLAALVASARKMMAQLASLLNEEIAFTLNHFEGQRMAVYAAGVGQGLILVAIVPKAVKQGTVLVYTRKAASEIEPLVPALATSMSAPPVTAPVSAPKPEPALAPATQSPAAPAPPPAPPQPEPEIELFGQDMLETSTGAPDSVQTLTWEEAMKQGLIGDLKL
jgi:DNA-binding response OmpR family regulator